MAAIPSNAVREHVCIHTVWHAGAHFLSLRSKPDQTELCCSSSCYTWERQDSVSALCDDRRDRETTLRQEKSQVVKVRLNTRWIIYKISVYEEMLQYIETTNTQNTKAAVVSFFKCSRLSHRQSREHNNNVEFSLQDKWTWTGCWYDKSIVEILLCAFEFIIPFVPFCSLQISSTI